MIITNVKSITNKKENLHFPIERYKISELVFNININGEVMSMMINNNNGTTHK